MNAFTSFETARLHLRRFEDTDADAALLVNLDSDPEVLRYLGVSGPVSVPEYRERIRLWHTFHSPRPQGVWATFERATGEFLGWVFLRPAVHHRFATEIGWTRETDLELGYRLKRAAWGCGYATEGAAALVRGAFDDPEATAVVATALVTNRGSTRVMEKVGLRYEREVPLPGFSDPCAVYALPRPTF